MTGRIEHWTAVLAIVGSGLAGVMDSAPTGRAAQVGSRVAAAALCGAATGKAGEYDGTTSQAQATGPNGTPLPARRVWLYREKTHEDCLTPWIFVFEWRNGVVHQAGCSLNTVPKAFIAFGDYAYQTSSRFARTAAWTVGQTRLHFDFSGEVMSNGTAHGVINASFGPTNGPAICASGTVTWTAKFRYLTGVSPIFQSGGQGFRIKRVFDAHHPATIPETCVDGTCSASQP